MFTVGNRGFNTFTEAEEYCIKSDFDPNTMIQETKEQTQKTIYWYELLFRGISPGCQPKGFTEVDHTKGKYGIVAYNRPLTTQELINYEMREYNEL